MEFLDKQGPEPHCGHKNKIFLYSELPQIINACPQGV